MRFQAIFFFKNHQFLAILHIMIENNDIQYLMAVQVLKKNLLAQKWANQGQKWAKMRFQAIFLFNMRQFLLVVHIMIDSYVIQQLMVVNVLKKIAGPKEGHLGLNLDLERGFCQFSLVWLTIFYGTSSRWYRLQKCLVAKLRVIFLSQPPFLRVTRFL